jgi:hypothetical protein
MKVIIQCSGTKHPSPFKWAGKSVSFVADPSEYAPSPGWLYARPDDRVPDTNKRWRDIVAEQATPELGGCLRAFDLYRPPIYGELASAFGYDNCFILSAGWGLVRGDFRLPDYDITFSPQAEKGKRRRKRDSYDDFNHLRATQEEVVVFAGLSYLPLLEQLLGEHRGPKTIYHKSDKFVRKPGYCYRLFKTRRCTNWHYDAAKAFIDQIKS